MADFPSTRATAQRRAFGMRGFQVLNHKDLPRLEAFFLSLSFDQRLTYFGAALSDDSVRDFCRTIHWGKTTVIARSAGGSVEAVAITTGRAGRRSAELSIACTPGCNPQAIIADLLDLALTTASLSYSQLIVNRERAMPELLALLHHSSLAIFDVEIVRIIVPPCPKIVAC